MTSLGCQQLNLSIAGLSIVDGLTLELEPGTFWGLLGSNGVGKTTLLKCLAGLRQAHQGHVRLSGRDLDQIPRKSVAQKVGMLQQHTAYVFDSSVIQTALTGRHPHLGYWQHEGPEDYAKAQAALEAVDLAGFADRSVISLSGGEARRLAFAALLVQEPEIMLLDEPTNHLDLRHQIRIMGIIHARTVAGTGSAIAALHDVNLAARYCTHVVMLFGQGQWCAGNTTEMLSTATLERLYGCAVERLEGSAGPRFYPLPRHCGPSQTG